MLEAAAPQNDGGCLCAEEIVVYFGRCFHPAEGISEGKLVVKSDSIYSRSIGSQTLRELCCLLDCDVAFYSPRKDDDDTQFRCVCLCVCGAKSTIFLIKLQNIISQDGKTY